MGYLEISTCFELFEGGFLFYGEVAEDGGAEFCADVRM